LVFQTIFKIMKKISIAFLLMALSQILMAQTDGEYKKMFHERIEKSGSSIVAVLVDENGARFVNDGTLSKDANSLQANENTIYEIGSLTKLFTGILLADAVKRGEVKLDAPISAYLPKTVKTPKFSGKEITLLDLATHTSGLPRMPDNFAPKDGLNPYDDYTTQNLYDFLSNYKLTREIGSEYAYSNLGVGLLGHILSLRAKMSFEQLMTIRILKPLKMDDTSFDLPSTKKTRHAQGFNGENNPTSKWFFDAFAGAGAIRSTSADMAKFISASVGITETPLSDAFIEARKMQRQGQSKMSKIGFCWNNVDLFGTEVFWHGGGTGGFVSYLAIDPKHKKGAFLVHNSAQNTMTAFLQSVAFNYLQPKFTIEKLQKPVAPKTEISLSEEILQTYVGEYQIDLTFSIVITREGKQLFAHATGETKTELFAEKEDGFFMKDIKADILFTKDDGGKINGLALVVDGRKILAKKVK
jgi:serine-type D-Ala-D-Ala carboxypeptidase/endopeptidase